MISGKHFLLAGAGVSGASLARVLADAGHKVTVVDRRSQIGGNCRDYRDEHGIMIHRYGPHIFHTSNEEVWNFLKPYVCEFPPKVTLSQPVL